MAMAIGKLMNGVIKMKHLVNPFSMNPKLTKSISSHADADANANTILFKRLVTKEDSGNQKNILSFLKYPYPIHDVVVENIDLPDSPYFDICGHTHGIVCLSDNHKNIILCNPATRGFRVLPSSILMTTSGSVSESVGLGYDPESKDFKVVRVVLFNEKTYKFDYKAEVLNTSKGGWRETLTSMPTPGFITPTFVMFHNGIYYWLNVQNVPNQCILTFDISNEVFGTLPVPESCLNVFDDLVDDYEEEKDLTILRLMVWKRSIVLLHYPAEGDEKSFDIWAMYDESDGGVSWSKVLTIGPLSGVVKPLLFVNSDELIMEAEDGKVISYNLITKDVKNLPVNGIPNSFTGFLFQKSLVSVA